MAEDIRARITIAVSNENAIQELAKVEAAIKRVTEARKKDLEIARHGSALPIVNNHKPPYPGKPTDTRPGFNLISLEQNREIERATTNLKDFNDQRLKQLQIQQKINTANTAGNAAQKALRELEGYNDLLSKMENRIAQMKPGTSQYRKQASDIERVKASIQALNGEYLKESIAAEKAKKSISGLSTEKQKHTKHTLAARIAAKLFHTEMGNGSLQMIKYGMITAGVAAVVKIYSDAMALSRDAHNRQAEAARRVTDLIRDKQSALQNEISEQNQAISVLDRIHKSNKLSEQDSIDLAIALDQLGGEFKSLAGDIDKATGKLNGYAKASVELRRNQLKNKVKLAQEELESVERQIEVHYEKQASSTYKFDNFGEDLKKSLATIFTLGIINFNKMETKLDVESRLKADDLYRERVRSQERVEKARKELEIFEKHEGGGQRYLAESTENLRDVFNSALKSLSAEIGKFRVTAQQAVEANSLEGIRLESRRFLNVNLPEDKSLAQVRAIGGDVKLLLNAVNSMKPYLMNTARHTQNLQNNITGTITYT